MIQIDEESIPHHEVNQSCHKRHQDLVLGQSTLYETCMDSYKRRKHHDKKRVNQYCEAQCCLFTLGFENQYTCIHINNTLIISQRPQVDLVQCEFKMRFVAISSFFLVLVSIFLWIIEGLNTDFQCYRWTLICIPSLRIDQLLFGERSCSII